MKNFFENHWTKTKSTTVSSDIGHSRLKIDSVLEFIGANHRDKKLILQWLEYPFLISLLLSVFFALIEITLFYWLSETIILFQLLLRPSNQLWKVLYYFEFHILIVWRSLKDMISDLHFRIHKYSVVLKNNDHLRFCSLFLLED